jgi:ABC-2 type transport system permease protein
MFSLGRDPVLLFLIAYCFTFSVYTPAKSAVMDVINASIALVDEDDSPLSRRIRDALLPPLFRPARLLPFSQINPAMDSGQFTFIIDLPRKFQSDISKGATPTAEVIADATVMAQAGRGPGYIGSIINREALSFWPGRSDPKNQEPVKLNTRVRFNPNVEQSWFVGINQIINNISVLALFLCGAAVLREREHGTLEHLLVMPLRPYELMFAKIWANGLVIIVAAMISLFLIVKGALGVPVAGSIPLFALGLFVYLFSVTALGIMLATMVRSMPQFGLLAFPVFIVMNLLSGGQTPLESMPVWLQKTMQFVPSTHFVSFAQAVLFRDANLSIVWPELAWMLAIGSVYSVYTLSRFRKMLAAVN